MGEVEIIDEAESRILQRHDWDSLPNGGVQRRIADEVIREVMGEVMPKYIIMPCGVTKDAEGNLPNGLVCSRAVYFTRFDEEKGYEVPVGLPIMFLRDFGMEKSAEELINSANNNSIDNNKL